MKMSTSLFSINPPALSFTLTVEVERAHHVVADILKRSYALFVTVNGQLQKVREFDPSTDSYIIADGPLYAGDHDRPAAEIAPPSKPLKKHNGGRRSVAARSHNAIAVAPTAGG
jgi:hypothetical protein